MMDILHRPRQNRAFRLLTRPVRNDAAELGDPFIDVPAPSTLDFFLENEIRINLGSDRAEPERDETNMIVFTLASPLI